jgi:hypothetical protein
LDCGSTANSEEEEENLLLADDDDDDDGDDERNRVVPVLVANGVKAQVGAATNAKMAMRGSALDLLEIIVNIYQQY